MTSSGARHRGFTIIELMIVVLMIAILAMVVRAALVRVSLRARGSAFLNDSRVFAEAFSRYAQEKGDFPADAEAGREPAGMTGYLNTTKWTGATPLGGQYEWDNKNARNSLGVAFRAAVKVTGCKWNLDDLRKMDLWFDDGNLSTGNIRVTDAGATVIYVIEP